MIFHRLRLINKNQGGYTLIELIVALAIIAFITGGIAMTIFQVITIEARTSNHMTAVRQVQTAGYWISHDGQMAQQVEAPDPDGFPLTLTWEEYVGHVEHQVVYSMINNSELQREHYTNRDINPDPDATTIVSQYIEFIEVVPRPFVGDEMILTVTARVGGDWQEGHETRVYEVIPRPDKIYH